MELSSQATQADGQARQPYSYLVLRPYEEKKVTDTVLTSGINDDILNIFMWVL